MDSFVIQPSVTEEWRTLVVEAESECSLKLGEELESYLIFLLIRFVKQPEIASSVIALDFLQGAEAQGNVRQERLRDLGDKCLLFSGLFPGRAQKRHVKISYFVEMGQSAYSTLSGLSKQQFANLFGLLCERFVSLMDVMHAMRDISNSSPSLLPLQAIELWQDTGSRHALKVLRQYSVSMPMRDKGKGSH